MLMSTCSLCYRSSKNHQNRTEVLFSLQVGSEGPSISTFWVELPCVCCARRYAHRLVVCVLGQAVSCQMILWFFGLGKGPSAPGPSWSWSFNASRLLGSCVLIHSFFAVSCIGLVAVSFVGFLLSRSFEFMMSH